MNQNNSILQSKLLKFITLLIAIGALTVSVIQSQTNKNNQEKEIIFDSSKSGMPKKAPQKKKNPKENSSENKSQKEAPPPAKDENQSQQEVIQDKKKPIMPSSKAPVIPYTIETRNEKK